METIISPEINYFDESFNTSVSQKYNLSIRVASDGFSFVVMDSYVSKFIGILSFSFPQIDSTERLASIWDNIVNKHSWLKLPFNTVYVLYETHKFTLIPASLFTEDAASKSLLTTHEITTDEVIEKNLLYHTDSYLIYTVDSSIKKMLLRTFVNINLFHHSVPLIEGVLSSDQKKNIDEKLFLNIRTNAIDIILFNSKGLRFFNSFPHSSNEDILYYLLYVIKLFHFNPDTMTLMLMGKINRQSSAFSLIEKYIKNIEFDQRPSPYKYSYVFDKILAHDFTPLFSIYSCKDSF